GAEPAAVAATTAEKAAPVQAFSPNRLEAVSPNKKITLELITAPKNREFVLGLEEPNLKGLAFKATVENETWLIDSGSETYYYSDEGTEAFVYYYVAYPEDGFVRGDNTVEICVSLQMFSSDDFYFDSFISRNDFYSSSFTVDFTATSMLDSMETSAPLSLDTASTAQLSPEEDAFTFFSFTPAKSGYYILTGVVKAQGDDLVDPFAYLVDDTSGAVLQNAFLWEDDGLSSVLIAGKTYYYAVNYYYYGDEAPSVEITLKVTGMEAAVLQPAKLTSVTHAEGQPVLFSFTPATAGLYSIRSANNANNADPYATLYGSGGELLGYDDDATINSRPLGTYNFNLNYTLEAGETVYILTQVFSNSAASYQIIADPAKTVLKKDATIYYGKSTPVAALLEESTHTYLYAESADYGIVDLDYYYGDLLGLKRGTTEVSLYEADGNALGTVNVKVNYTFFQWILVIFLGGWAWMDPYLFLNAGDLLDVDDLLDHLFNPSYWW
ncbi:MAG: hypothetical protein LBQ33_05425, partial [Oscillospiraceae bacterium]|nr:hypothetical protein [Oscillospiraceae bacterium]